MSEKNTISNNIFTTYGFVACGAILNSLGSSTISHNTFTAYGDQSCGATLEHLVNNTLSTNTFITYGNQSVGIGIFSSHNNNISGGSIISKSNYDYYIENASNTNNFMNIDFTSTRRIYFNDITSWFNYNNETDGDIWLKTRISLSQQEIARSLVKWGKDELIWYDSSMDKDSLAASYAITGLHSVTNYYVYVTSGETLSNPYTFSTDSTGNLPVFTITLEGSTKIRVVDKSMKPP